ncbi:MAG: cytochrome c [Betaproteobacteria bacterium]|nr:cytochrome c [Betaproteobacteria bacterium]MDE2423106.1 cytochrome c [Betaproteobacteria bacterium]
MKRATLFVFITLLPGLACAWPWSRDMANQISIKPEEGPQAVRPFPKTSVPMAGTQTTPFIKTHDEAMKLKNPNLATEQSVNHGRELFQIYCVPCHGVSGTGDGLVGAKLLVRPFDLTADNVQKIAPEGYIFAHITYGGPLMPSYGNDMYPKERWDVVNYVRHALVADNRKAAQEKNTVSSAK